MFQQKALGPPGAARPLTTQRLAQQYRDPSARAAAGGALCERTTGGATAVAGGTASRRLSCSMMVSSDLYMALEVRLFGWEGGTEHRPPKCYACHAFMRWFRWFLHELPAVPCRRIRMCPCHIHSLDGTKHPDRSPMESSLLELLTTVVLLHTNQTPGSHPTC